MTIFLPDLLNKERISIYLPSSGDNIDICIDGKEKIHLDREEFLAACEAMIIFYKKDHK